MIRIVGSVLILSGGGLLWWLQMHTRRRRRAVLADLIRTLRGIQEEIRMMRTPLPELLETQAKHCGTETAELLHAVAAAAASGEPVAAVWKTGVHCLPLSDREQEILLGVQFGGDEETVRREISVSLYGLANCAEELDCGRAEEEKRVAALCFSGAALLVILLI